MKKRFRKISLGLLLAGFVALNLIAYNHAYHFTHFSDVKAKRIKPEDLSFPQKVKIAFLGIKNPKPINKKWPDPSYETIHIQSKELLETWFKEIEKHKGIVLLFHGYSGSKADNIGYGKAFNKLGYSTLLVDFMGSGGSSGNQTTIGFKESLDVQKCFEYIQERFPQDSIILFGASMGAVSIMKAISDYHLEADKIILECPFGTMRKTTNKRFQAMGIPSFPFSDLLLFYGGLQNGFIPETKWVGKFMARLFFLIVRPKT